MEVFIIVLLGQAIVSAGFCAYLASQKGRDSVVWFFLGLLFGLLALIAIAAVPAQTSPPSGSDGLGSTPGRALAPTAPAGRLCPFCMESIHESATVCPHCQRDLPTVEKCAYCGKVINPGDERTADNFGQVFCSRHHVHSPTEKSENSNESQARHYRRRYGQP